jgi:hypothetical protein
VVGMRRAKQPVVWQLPSARTQAPVAEDTIAPIYRWPVQSTIQQHPMNSFVSGRRVIRCVLGLYLSACGGAVVERGVCSASASAPTAALSSEELVRMEQDRSTHKYVSTLCFLRPFLLRTRAACSLERLCGSGPDAILL